MGKFKLGVAYRVAQKEKGLTKLAKPFVFLVAGVGFEPTTFGL
ncbi:MAG: hypothetical protein A4E71_02416 [Smithella sp. PtaU1.Bin162]|nr:MAG: hypothetical protein A4E71_02416 [Smithella sp. PtaU1.Bin162]